MNIVLVEDDPTQRAEIIDALGERYPAAKIRIIKTEFEFMESLESLRNLSQRPDIFLIDIMLRWTDPRPNMPPRPPNTEYLDAGLRCAAALHEVMRGVPTVVYTVLDRQDIGDTLPAGVRYVCKSSDFRPLYEAIADLTQPASKAGTA